MEKNWTKDLVCGEKMTNIRYGTLLPHWKNLCLILHLLPTFFNGEHLIAAEDELGSNWQRQIVSILCNTGARMVIQFRGQSSPILCNDNHQKWETEEGWLWKRWQGCNSWLADAVALLIMIELCKFLPVSIQNSSSIVHMIFSSARSSLRHGVLL